MGLISFRWFMGHQSPCSLPGPRVIAVEDADVEQVLEKDVKRRNEMAYDFVGDVVRTTGISLCLPSRVCQSLRRT